MISRIFYQDSHRRLKIKRSKVVGSQTINLQHQDNRRKYATFFFQLDDPVLENIREELNKIDINTLTPIEALMKLNSIKNLIGK